MNKYGRYHRHVARGIEVSPRAQPTRARFNQTFEFEPGQYFHREGGNPAIGFIEGLQFIAGMEDKEAIQAVAPNVNINLFGPTSFYGPRVVNQVLRVINELKKDEATRRAILLIAHDDDESDTMPCTTSMQFYVRPGTVSLDCTVNMRSSDVVWGLPYDMIQFGMMHIAIASCTYFTPGTCTVNMCNSHIYESHPGSSVWTEMRFDVPRFLHWHQYVEWAKGIVEFRPTAKELYTTFKLEKYDEHV